MIIKFPFFLPSLGVIGNTVKTVLTLSKKREGEIEDSLVTVTTKLRGLVLK